MSPAPDLCVSMNSSKYLFQILTDKLGSKSEPGGLSVLVGLINVTPTGTKKKKKKESKKYFLGSSSPCAWTKSLDSRSCQVLVKLLLLIAVVLWMLLVCTHRHKELVVTGPAVLGLGLRVSQAAMLSRNQ